MLLLHQRGLRRHLKVHYQGQTPIELEEQRRAFARQYFSKEWHVLQPNLRNRVFYFSPPFYLALGMFIRHCGVVFCVCLQKRVLPVVDLHQLGGVLVEKGQNFSASLSVRSRFAAMIFFLSNLTSLRNN